MIIFTLLSFVISFLIGWYVLFTIPSRLKAIKKQNREILKILKTK